MVLDKFIHNPNDKKFHMKRVLLAKRNILHKKNLPAPAIVSFPSFFFNPFTIIRILLTTGMAIFFLQVFAQPGNEKKAESDYRKVITERSAKIVNTLEITDSGKYNEALTDIVNQYSQLNTIDEQSKAAIAEIKAQSLSKEATDEAIKKARRKKIFPAKAATC